MSEEPFRESEPNKPWIPWPFRILVAALLLFILAGLTSPAVVAEAPFHFLLGWWMHAAKNLPPVIVNWRATLLPLGCLVLAVLLIHRFASRWLDAKGSPRRLRPAETIAATSLFLLGCGAAIALSGIVHQSVWLMGDPWTEDRSRRTELTFAVNNARQLMMALMKYREENDSYPNSFRELETELNSPPRLAWAQTGSRNVPEPFTLLLPGSRRLMYMDEPVFVSPVIPRDGKIVVGYADGSVRILPAVQLSRILQKLGPEQPRPPRIDE